MTRLWLAFFACSALAFGQMTQIPAAASGAGGGGSAYATVTDGSPITWSLGSAFVANGTVTLAHATATRALNLTGLVNGGFYTLILKQDGVGGAALTLGTGCTWKVSSGGAGAITLTTTANGIDILEFTYDGTNCYANLQTTFN